MTYKELYMKTLTVLADIWEEIYESPYDSQIYDPTMRSPEDIYEDILNPLYRIMKRDNMESNLQDFVNERDAWRHLGPPKHVYRRIKASPVERVDVNDIDENDYFET